MVFAIAITVLLTVPSRAHSQEADVAGVPDAAAVRRTGDASADRNVLLPTAETLNKGTVAFNSYELLFAGLSYGINDRFELSATTMLPITSDIPLLLNTSLKWNFYRSGRAVVSVMPSLFIGRSNGFTIGGFGGSVIADRILDEAGKFVLTGGAMTQFLFGGSDDIDLADAGVLLLWTSISARLGEHVKLLGELILPGAYTWAGGGQFELVEEGLLFGYGVRFFGKTLAVDLTFLRPIHPDVDTGPLLMGVPWVAFSAQF